MSPQPLWMTVSFSANFCAQSSHLPQISAGVDYMHPDLIHNYNARASYDFSSNDPYPYPRYTDDWFNSHGTRCAGEVAGARDNGVCGTGVAYDSMVAGTIKIFHV